MSTLGRIHDRTDVAVPEAPEAPAPAAPAPAGPGPGPRIVVPRWVWFCAGLAVLVLATAIGARVIIGGLAGLNPFANGVIQQRTVDRSGPAVLKAVTDLGALQSAGGYYEVVIDVEKSVDHVPSFLAGRRVLFVAAGTVDAGVDLRTMGADAVTVNDARTSATVRLPRPKLSEPHLDLDRSYLYTEERGLVDRVADAVKGSPDDQKEVYQLASRRLAQAAAANDELVKRAETNARGVLQGMLRPLGFTDVTVTFAD